VSCNSRRRTTSFDVDLDAVTLLAVGLIVAIAFGVGWIVRGRR
jgi:hypothetical protein